MNNYETLAAVTKSDQFHGEMIPRLDVMQAIGAAVAALQVLDAVKKTLFYGRPFPHPMGQVSHNAMDILGPWEAANVAVGDYIETTKSIDVIHSILGVATEAGELLELLLATIQSKRFDEVNFAEELGDVFWYQAIGCNAVGSSFDEEQMRNIAKLKKRFGDKFTEFYALNRNLVAERQTLEGDVV